MAKKPVKPAARDWGIIGRIGYILFGPANSNNARSWVVLILLILLVRWVWFEPYKIPSGSMEPTLHGVPSFFDGDRVFVNKHSYGIRVPFMSKYIFQLKDPERWDIAVFRAAHENPKHKILIKRVVGLPGDHVHIGREGELYINGERMEYPEELRDVLYYTRGISLPREEFDKFMIEQAASDGKIDKFVYWNDLAKAAVIDSSLRNQVPAVLNPDHPAFEDYKQEMARLRAAMDDKDIRSVAAATAAGITETVGQQAMLVAKEILINERAYTLGLEPDMGSIIFSQPAIEQFYEDLDMVRARYAEGADDGALLEGVSDKSYRLVSELWRMQQQDATPFQYGIRTEEEYSVIPPDHYMMLGDNSGNSVDSRVWGWVPREHFVGRTFAIWMPVSRWHDFTGWSATWWGKGLLFGLPIMFFALGYIHHTVRRTVRVSGNIGLPGHQSGGKIIIDCAAYGLRWPFIAARMTRGAEPVVGEHVMCKLGHNFYIGNILALPGDEFGKKKEPLPPNVYAVEVHEDEAVETYEIPRRNLIGRARPARGLLTTKSPVA